MATSRTVHMHVNCANALKNPSNFYNCIIVDGRILVTDDEITDFFIEHLRQGHDVIPCGDCNNFDYKQGCLGHEIGGIS